MSRRFKLSRLIRSKLYANIILANGLFDEWKFYKYNHQKIKSDYRLANLFLLNKKLRWSIPDKFIDDLDMNNLEVYYYDD